MVPANLILPLVGGPRWLAFLCVAWGAVATASAGIHDAASFLALRCLLGVTEVPGPREGPAPGRDGARSRASCPALSPLFLFAAPAFTPRAPPPTPKNPKNQAGVVPAMLYYLTSFYSQSRLTVPYTLVVLGQTLAQVLGAPLAAAILLLDGRGGLAGWRWLFLLEGVPSVLLAGAMWWAPGRGLGGGERAVLPDGTCRAPEVLLNPHPTPPHPPHPTPPHPAPSHPTPPHPIPPHPTPPHPTPPHPTPAATGASPNRSTACGR
jgi:hypothetical protein